MEECCGLLKPLLKSIHIDVDTVYDVGPGGVGTLLGAVVGLAALNGCCDSNGCLCMHAARQDYDANVDCLSKGAGCAALPSCLQPGSEITYYAVRHSPCQ